MILKKGLRKLPYYWQERIRHLIAIMMRDPTDIAERIIISENLDSYTHADFQTLAHIVRYKWVLPLVRGKYCLDDGCGTGYGTNYLAQLGVSIIGIDKSKVAIKYASKHYSGPNLKFKCANSLKLGFKDEEFEAVISFEVLEHLDDEEQHQFLQETRRILKVGGYLFIGTPERNELLTEFERNAHHRKELDYYEFRNLLEKFFKINQYLSQQIVLNGKYLKNDWPRYDLTKRRLDESNFLTIPAVPECFELLAICEKVQ